MTQYEIPIESKKKKSIRIPIEKLHDFDGHPYKVTDNEDMDKLEESIKSQGIINPLIVRPKDNTTDEYEVIRDTEDYTQVKGRDSQKYQP